MCSRARARGEELVFLCLNCCQRPRRHLFSNFLGVVALRRRRHRRAPSAVMDIEKNKSSAKQSQSSVSPPSSDDENDNITFPTTTFEKSICQAKKEGVKLTFQQIVCLPLIRLRQLANEEKLEGHARSSLWFLRIYWEKTIDAGLTIYQRKHLSREKQRCYRRIIRGLKRYYKQMVALGLLEVSETRREPRPEWVRKGSGPYPILLEIPELHSIKSRILSDYNKLSSTDDSNTKK